MNHANRSAVAVALAVAALAPLARAEGPSTRPAETRPAATRPAVVRPVAAASVAARPATGPVAVAGPSRTAAAGPASTQPAVVPIEVMPSGHLAIMAKINGRGPYRFVFDTGAPTLLISERVAKLAAVLPPHFRRPFFTMLGNLGPHRAESIDLGHGGRLDGLVTDVWNHPTVDLLAREEGPLEGIIGFPFFAHFRTTIDYKARTLTFVPCAYVPADIREQMQQRMEAGEARVIDPAVSLGIRVAKDARDAGPGVIVTDVPAGGAAADAGLMIGDRLLTLDGRWTDAVDDVYRAAESVDPAATAVPATLSRDGRPAAVRIGVRHGV